LSLLVALPAHDPEKLQILITIMRRGETQGEIKVQSDRIPRQQLRPLFSR
jgi:hypothetical protein